MRRQSHPELLTVKTDKTQKIEKGDKTEIHTSRHYGIRGFTGGRDRSVIVRETKQRKEREEGRQDRQWNHQRQVQGRLEMRSLG